MKIIDERIATDNTTFGSLRVGDLFFCGISQYMKVEYNGKYFACSLADGRIYDFSDESAVVPADAELRIRLKEN